MVNDSKLKAAVLDLRNVFALYLPIEDVATVLRKAVERALAEVLGNIPKRRGRPPKNPMAALFAAAAPAAPAAKTAPKKKGRSPASRALQAAKMRAYWAGRKSKESGAKSPAKKKRGRPAKAKPKAPETPPVA